MSDDEKSLEDALCTVIAGQKVYLLGDMTTEIWDANGIRVYRTFQGEDGKMRTEEIDPREFYDIS